MHIRNTLIAFLLPLSVVAQESRNGPKLGIGISSQTAGQFLAWSGQPKFGPLIGWSFEAPITSQVSLLLEPMYIAKGSRTVNSVYKIRTSITLNYIEMPMLLKVSTNPDPQGLFLTGGLLYGYYLGGKIKSFDHGEMVTNTAFTAEGTKRSQWSAAIGIGHELGSWMWELRGQSSLSTFNRYYSSHNVVFSLQVAWRFPTQEEKDRRRKAKQQDED